ncbi:glycosyltransferase [Epilithonimonas sp.]|uniref:glycosyltransferase n=1 Tax=Epilithonimonas sp. TaxID=2894511 RepID=UPI00289F8642|nr:glycosyltransferase [Epilithonimonas sp.]
MILFLSKYPQTEEDFRDGLYQRVIHIDSLFEGKKKVYLFTSPYRFFKKTYIAETDQNRVIIRCNLILHIGLILNLYRKSKTIYIHSIHNLLYQFMFFKIFNRKYVLDLHGLVPEEFLLEGDRKRSIIFGALEKYIYNNLKFVIGVTQRLVNHYQKKYPFANTEYIVYPILPNNLEDISDEEIKMATNADIVNFIYSGNLQAWQNIDFMIDNIKLISNNQQYFFQILTGEVEEMKNKFLDKNIDMSNIDIRGVRADELAAYYKKAHYGFVLRNDIPINNVACPTKLVEYMNYGIVPIVLSDEIGDFKSMGYESLSVNNISENILSQKSLRNIEIIKELYKESSKIKTLIKNLY